MRHRKNRKPKSNNRKKVLRKRYAHAGQRAQERYGLALTDLELDVIAQRIRKQKGTVFLRRISNTRTEWLLSWQDGVVRVGYCSNTHQVTTFLPLPDVQQEVLKQMFDKLQAKKKEKRDVLQGARPSRCQLQQSESDHQG